MVTIVKNTLLHIWKLLRVDLRSPHPKGKKNRTMHEDAYQTFCGNHCATYTHIISLGCIPKSSMLYVSYTSIRIFFKVLKDNIIEILKITDKSAEIECVKRRTCSARDQSKRNNVWCSGNSREHRESRI